MLIEQIIELYLRGPGPPGRTCTPITGYFHDKTKSLRKIFQWIVINIAKMLQETVHLTFPYLDQITYN